jgi:membrane protein implicated in regulation of membrane protease activity
MHMPWWGWGVAGLGLLALELFVIDAEFYLVFIGASAALVGVLGLVGLPLPEWAQWVLFAALSLVSMFTFRGKVYALLRGTAGHVQERVTAGDKVVVPTRLEPGQSCRVEYRGTSWTARNIGAHAIVADTEAIISHIDDLTLHVTARSA